MANLINSTGSTHTVGQLAEPESIEIPQYSLARILAVWAGAALPMAALAWVVAPWVAGSLEGPAPWPRALILTLTIGLVWQFVLVTVLIRREQGSLRWPVVKEALWLNAPRSPRSGRRGGRLWLIVVPLVVLVAFKEALPSLPTPAARDFATVLESDAGQAWLSGSWDWFALLIVMFVFNTVLGEELLFRGLLLPRMQGVFGSSDWIANGVLFGFYHLHVPWGIPKALLDTFLYVYPAKRYRSTLVSMAVHSAQSVVIAAFVLVLVLK